MKKKNYIKNSQPQTKFTGSYKKEYVLKHFWLEKFQIKVLRTKNLEQRNSCARFRTNIKCCYNFGLFFVT